MLLLHNRGRRTGVDNVNPLAYLPMQRTRPPYTCSRLRLAVQNIPSGTAI